LVRCCPTGLIWLSLGLTLVLDIFIFAAAFQSGDSSGQFFGGLLVVLQVCWMWCARSRIAFAAVMMDLASTVTSAYWGALVVALGGIGVLTGVLTLWGYSALMVLSITADDADAHPAANTMAYVFYAFCMFWIVFVKRYVVHCTSAGCMGTWYFQVSEGATSLPAAAWGSLKRACTTSFGSVCYGALIIAVIETLEMVMRQGQSSKNDAARFMSCCITCLLGCIKDIVEYLNSYAFAFVAVYGDSYCDAVSKTMAVFYGAGFTMIINDNLVDTVLGFGNLGCAVLCGSFAVGSVAASQGNTDSQGWTPPMTLAAGLGAVIGFAILAIVNTAISASVRTFFVLFAVDPLVLYNTKPCTFNRVMDAFSERWGGQRNVPCYAFLQDAMPRQMATYQSSCDDPEAQPITSNMY